MEAHGAKSPGEEGAAPREGSETASLLPPLRTDQARVMLFTKADTRRWVHGKTLGPCVVGYPGHRGICPVGCLLAVWV